MLKKRLRVSITGFLSCVVAVCAGACVQACAAEGYPHDKPVISVLVPDWSARLRAAAEAALSYTELSAFGALVAAEQASVATLLHESDRVLAERPGESSERILRSIGYDDSVVAIVRRSEEGLSALGAAPAERLRRWLDHEWERQRALYGLAPAVRPGFMTYSVFVTQYIGETNEEIAVPDRYVKFASRNWQHAQGYDGTDYQVALDYNGHAIDSVRVWDVGPWNLDDNYWDPTISWPRPRRLFTDLPRGMPEAQAAYYSGYNAGKDQSGRTVLNPAGCDQTPAVAARLGLAYLQNAWITVTYWWEPEPLAVGRSPGVESPAHTTVRPTADGWTFDLDVRDPPARCSVLDACGRLVWHSAVLAGIGVHSVQWPATPEDGTLARGIYLLVVEEKGRVRDVARVCVAR
jgi:hypothetical protein